MSRSSLRQEVSLRNHGNTPCMKIKDEKLGTDFGMVWKLGLLRVRSPTDDKEVSVSSNLSALPLGVAAVVDKERRPHGRDDEAEKAKVGWETAGEGGMGGGRGKALDDDGERGRKGGRKQGDG